MIRYLKNHEIDKQKWDRCIETANNGLIYGYSFYLDHLSRHWDALVSEDYKHVMPLTWNKKYGIHYLYQPVFTASLGIFGNHMTAAVVKDFLQAVPDHFKYWDIYLNRKNLFANTGFKLYERTNYILDLSSSYEDMYRNFSETHKRNIKKAQRASCAIVKDIAVSEVIRIAKKQSKKFSAARNQDFENFRQLFEYLHTKKKALTFAVMKENKLLASCAFLFSHKRAYYILVGNAAEGKAIGASQFLFNEFIKENAGKKMLLDFEGSMIPGLAMFYSGFGAVAEKYAGVKVNKLPKLVRLFKR